MLTLGEMLTHGVGVKANPTEAMAWFNKAYARGHVSALNGVGYLHAKGLGVPQDYHKAVQNFLTAARKTRDVDALYNLGMSHLRGQGVRRNPNKALQFLQQAVEGQHVGAMYQMGKMHLTGTGVPKNVVMVRRGNAGMLLQGLLLKGMLFKGTFGTGCDAAVPAAGGGGEGQHVGAIAHSSSSLPFFTASPFLHCLSLPLLSLSPFLPSQAARLLKAVAERGGGRAGSMGGHAALGWVYVTPLSIVPGFVLSLPFVQAARLLKAVAEWGPWGVMLRWAHACSMSSTQGPSLCLWSLWLLCYHPSPAIPLFPPHPCFPFLLLCSSFFSFPLPFPSLLHSLIFQAARLLKAVAERGPWGVMLRWAHACFMSSTHGPSLWSLSRSASSSSPFSLSFSFSLSSPLSPSSLRSSSSSSSSSPSSWPASCDVGTSLMLYSRAAELGYEVAQGNAAWLLDKVHACLPFLKSNSLSSAPSTCLLASCDVGTSLMLYSRAAELGYEVAQGNAARLLDKLGVCVSPHSLCSQ
ncbi:unnamed protein product [Closterium sp. NIES-54]